MQETTKHALWSCSLAQQVWNKVLSLFLTINAGCLFSWGSTVWGVLHSSLLLYEADDAPEAMSPHFNNLVSKTRATHVWKTISTITLWKYDRCKRRHVSIISLLSNITIYWVLRMLFLRKGKKYCCYGGSCLCSPSPLKDRSRNITTLGPCHDHPFL